MFLCANVRQAKTTREKLESSRATPKPDSLELKETSYESENLNACSGEFSDSLNKFFDQNAAGKKKELKNLQAQKTITRFKKAVTPKIVIQRKNKLKYLLTGINAYQMI